MKHNSVIYRFTDFLDQLLDNVTERQKKQIVGYYNFLLEWNKKINLVSRNNTTTNLINNLVSSSIYVSILQKQQGENISRIADFGTGGGFPGILLSIFFPDKEIVLIDSSRKKTLFLKKLIHELDLNQEIKLGRIEDVASVPNIKYDCVVALAFAPLETLIKYAVPHLQKSGMVLTLKGNNYLSEVTNKENIITKIYTEKINPEFYKFAPFLEEKTMLRLEL